MQITLNGKKALVTGGTRGIGRAVTLALAEAGADVLACYRRDSTEVDTLAAALKEFGGDHHLVKADVSRESDVDQLAEEARIRFGRLDTVVNNAGTISHIPFRELTREQWDKVVGTNLTGTFSVTSRVLPLMSRGGSVVLIGSKAATVGVPDRVHYTASKAALTGLCRSLCKELGPDGIRVNVVAPGIIDTQDLGPEATERYRRIISLGRLGTAREIATVVAFLASDLASYLTGETINVDGGT